MTQSRSRAVAGVVALAAIGSGWLGGRAALGQCQPEWQPMGAAHGMSGQILAVTTWDPDGLGPQTEQVVAGGEFMFAGGARVNYIARWDGTHWAPFGPGFNSTVRALTTWDPDGPGPQHAQLIAGGDFVVSNNVELHRVARWDGVHWRPLGSGPNVSPVHALTTWDPDGPGPQHEHLVAGGGFGPSGPAARWDGAQWHAFGPAPMISLVYALTTWDPDGVGPEAARLVAGGQRTGREATPVVYWDGAQWTPLGSEWVQQGVVYSLAAWDPDGAGPQAPRLFAGGEVFSEWDGDEWTHRGPSRPIRALVVCDVDGPGPETTQLVLGGEFIQTDGVQLRGLGRWDGIQVLPFPTLPALNTRIGALTTWDPDGAGPEAPRLVAGTGLPPGGTANEVIRWDADEWTMFDRETNGPVAALTPWDPDGPGPEAEEVVAGGRFTMAGEAVVNGVARWDGDQWRRIGLGFTGEDSHAVLALTTWDPDGPGPEAAALIAGGRFTSSGPLTLNHIARWESELWVPLGAGASGSVLALTTWDADGPGPELSQLIAGGWFTTAGDVEVNHIAGWDGSNWHSIGGGADSTILALTTWDPDGSGPQPADLVAGGAFTHIGGVSANSIARWNGVQWVACGAGMSGGDSPYVYALTTWDPDGSGPHASILVAAGRFTMADGVVVNRIAGWDGKRWTPFGAGFNTEVGSVASWDPDGAGPQAPQLIARGTARWDGEEWRTIPSGPNRPANCLTVWDAGGTGAPQLVAGGDFTQVGWRSAGYAAVYACPECPCDWNQSGGLDSQDMFDFLIAFFGGYGNYNRDAHLDSQDLFDFLTCFYGGCP